MAWSDSSDYYAYYDRKLDSEGGLTLSTSLRSSQLVVERPYGAGEVYYRFNKVRCETFIYDVLDWFPETKGVKE